MAVYAGVSPKQIRQRVAETLGTMLAPLGFVEAAYVGLRLPENATLAGHHQFAVILLGSEFLAGRQSRAQDPGRGAYCQTTVEVRWIARLRPDNEVADYDAALDSELAILDALRSLEQDQYLTLRLESVQSRDNPPGLALFAGTIRATCHHTYPLGA